ncbi:hypothetical protein [Candidatus Profftia lariciata]|uniref:hypothetical protein n=1 Tax=Candidatus Profftia lariciata TaxID=1987921 RepID=UPI001D02B749|nr:hypothetical protein [Candidatus Profftia lariciata]
MCINIYFASKATFIIIENPIPYRYTYYYLLSLVDLAVNNNLELYKDIHHAITVANSKSCLLFSNFLAGKLYLLHFSRFLLSNNHDIISFT